MADNALIGGDAPSHVSLVDQIGDDATGRERVALLSSVSAWLTSNSAWPDTDTPLDWSYLLTESMRHSVLPLVYRYLRHCSSCSVPESELRKFRRSYHTIGLMARHASGEIGKIGEALGDRGVGYLVVKGVPLALDAYGEVALRRSGDIDLLVREHDFATTTASLSEMGFVPYADGSSETPLDAESIDPRTSRLKGVTLRGRSVHVDLHWTLEDRPFLAGFDTHDLFDRARHVRLEEVDVPTMSLEDNILFLCVHGAKHNWSRLGWIADIAGLVRHQKSIDWHRLDVRSRDQPLARYVNLGLILSSHMLDVRPPEFMYSRAVADRRAVQLAEQVARWLFDPPAPWDINMFRLRLFGSPAWKVSYMLHRLRTRGKDT